MVDRESLARIHGAGLIKTEGLWHMPQHRGGRLESFVWQTVDTAPGFPRLRAFPDHWRREIAVIIHPARLVRSG
jgi:uncharacterized protein Usg